VDVLIGLRSSNHLSALLVDDQLRSSAIPIQVHQPFLVVSAGTLDLSIVFKKAEPYLSIEEVQGVLLSVEKAKEAFRDIYHACPSFA
jgi:hypothetical protein